MGCVSCGVHTRLCAHAPFLIHVEARVRYWVLSSIILHVTALRHGLSLSKKLSLWMSLADLVSSGNLPISTLGPQCWGYRSMEVVLAFYVGPGDRNPGPHTCRGSFLLTELSLSTSPMERLPSYKTIHKALNFPFPTLQLLGSTIPLASFAKAPYISMFVKECVFY